MTNNTLADLIARIRMGAQTRKKSIKVANTNIARRLVDYFVKQNLIISYQISADEKNLEIFFRFAVGSNANVLAQVSLFPSLGVAFILNLVTL